MVTKREEAQRASGVLKLSSSAYSEHIQERRTPKRPTVSTLSSIFSSNLVVYLEGSGLFLPADVHGEQSWPLVNIMFFCTE